MQSFATLLPPSVLVYAKIQDNEFGGYYTMSLYSDSCESARFKLEADAKELLLDEVVLWVSLQPQGPTLCE